VATALRGTVPGRSVGVKRRSTVQG